MRVSLCRLLESYAAADGHSTSNSGQQWTGGCTREGSSNRGL